MRRSYVVSLIAIIVVAAGALGATLASGNSPRLGLDLQGGASVVLNPVDNSQVHGGTLAQAIKIIRARVNGLGVSEADVTQQGNSIVVQLPGVKDPCSALNLVGQTAQLEFRHVLQTFPAGGTLQDAYKNSGGIASPAATSCAAGSGSATTSTTAPGATTTTAPGATTTTAPGATTTAPGATTGAPTTVATPTSGALGRRGADTRVAIAGAVQPQTAPPPSTPDTGGTTPPPAAPISPSTPPTPSAATAPPLTPLSQIQPNSNIVVPEVTPGTDQIVAEYLLGPVDLKGSEVAGAVATAPTGLAGGWTVEVSFKSVAPFDNLAKKYYQQQVAIVLDNKVVSAPTINSTSFAGKASISGGSGGFTHKQSNDLALVLRYGSLPVQLQQQAVQNVSATLGKDSLHAGLVAGVIGLILVLLYMILYYRALGLVVVLGLSVSGALLYSLITYLGTTSFGLALSLAGATGIIVSVGVTADSYIVYFERLKDEIRTGKSIRSSVDRGFARAWRTIVSADLVSLIGALLLWWLTVGPVRGFAFFLGLSTMLDLLVAYTFTRPMVVALGRNRAFTQARFFGVARGLAATPAGSSS